MLLRNPKLAAVAIFIFVFLLPGMNQNYASENLTEVSSLKIDLWPEYDKPMVLVMIDGWIAESVELPIEVRLSVMEGGSVHMGCSITPAGGHIHESFKEGTDGDGNYVTFVLRERQFHLEYYYNSFRDTPFRKFDYYFKSPFNISNVQVEIKEPLGSTGFILNPPSKFPMKNRSGITIHSLNIGEVKIGEEIIISAEYSKNDLIPSNKRVNKFSSTVDTYKFLTILFGSILFILLGYAAFRWSSAPSNTDKKHKKKSKKHKNRQPIMSKSTDQNRINFCFQCGNELKSPFHYCGVCGTKITVRKN
ncbi:MAG: zinc ribbon domain-containing protein [Candidatus Marinimicrobia bacterium]|nr:zinc ribbon domain-containing protein [Candidatus Neomarinimicrobiota bacterium]